MNKQQRKTYTKPILSSEVFVPNTYVAACKEEYGVTEYTISCTEPNNLLQQIAGTGHTEGGCRRESAFKVTVINGIITTMIEDYNKTGLWNEAGPCENIKILSGGTWINANSVSIAPNGTYQLQWTTDVGRDMKHSGTLNCATDKYKNMS